MNHFHHILGFTHLTLIPYLKQWTLDSIPILFLTSQVAQQEKINDQVNVVITAAISTTYGDQVKIKGYRIICLCRIISDKEFGRLSSQQDEKCKDSKKKKKKKMEKNRQQSCHEIDSTTSINSEVLLISNETSISGLTHSNVQNSQQSNVIWCPYCHRIKNSNIQIGGNAALFRLLGFDKAPTSSEIIHVSLLSLLQTFIPPLATKISLKVKNAMDLLKDKETTTQQNKIWTIFDRLQTHASHELLCGTLMNRLFTESMCIKFFLIDTAVEFEIVEIQLFNSSSSNTSSENVQQLNDSLRITKDSSNESFLPPQNREKDICSPLLSTSSLSMFTQKTSSPFMELCPNCLTSYPPLFRIDQKTTVIVQPPIRSPFGHLKNTNQWSSNVQESQQPPQQLVGMSRIGGLTQVVQELRDIFIIPLMFPYIFSSFGIQPPKGVLLYGPPGTGKTLLAKALTEEIELRWYELWKGLSKNFGTGQRIENQAIADYSCPPLAPVVEVFSASHVVGGFGSQGGEEEIHALFRRCRDRLIATQRGSLIFIDEIDAVCPDREQAGEAERRIVSTFLTNLDGLTSDSRIVLLGATNRPNAIDPALRRGGRLDREIEIDVPNGDDRVAILSKMLQPVSHNLTEQQINKIAWDCQAFVGADLRCLCTSAALKAIEELTATENNNSLDRVRVLCFEHFVQALKDVRPSAMKSISVEIPKIYWDDVGGYDNVKQKLKECVEWPIKYRHIFSELNTTPPRGLLLYGPPGCSKTLLAKAVATESRMNFIAVKGPELFSKYVGESEKAVRDVFRKARQNAPCIIFFDEVDSLGSDRETSSGSSGVESRVLNQMLNEMDGIGVLKQVVVIGATNRPDLLDAALLRPGRLDRLVYVPLPDLVSREKVLQVHFRHLPLETLPENNSKVVVVTDIFSFDYPETEQKNKDRAEEAIKYETSELIRGRFSSKCTDVGFIEDVSAEQGLITSRPFVISGNDICQQETREEIACPTSIKDQLRDNAGNGTCRTANTEERNIFIKEIAKCTEGYSGAELAMVCRESAMMALRERVEKIKDVNALLGAGAEEEKPNKKVIITWQHVINCLNIVKPRIPESMIKFYENYQNKTTIQR